MFTKAEVGYESPAKGPNHCGDCKHFEVKRKNGCEIVEGFIRAGDWCRKFEHSGESYKENRAVLRGTGAGAK